MAGGGVGHGADCMENQEKGAKARTPPSRRSGQDGVPAGDQHPPGMAARLDRVRCLLVAALFTLSIFRLRLVGNQPERLSSRRVRIRGAGTGRGDTQGLTSNAVWCG
jgi:hypothetical protein